MMSVRFYCDACEKSQLVEIEPLTTDDLNPDKAWGDIVCKVCHLVIATISTNIEEQGIYDVVKVGEVPRVE